MSRFLVLRDKADATPGDAIDRFKGHEIDPELGQYGGFVFDVMEFREAVGEIPKPGEVSLLRKLQNRKRKILRQYVVEDGIGQKHNVYECAASQEDAEYYANVRNWRYVAIFNDAHLAQYRPAAQPVVEEPAVVEPVVQMEGIPRGVDIDASLPARPRRGRPPAAEAYRRLQMQAKTLMAAGAPGIALNSTVPELKTYIATYESVLVPEPQSS